MNDLNGMSNETNSFFSNPVSLSTLAEQFRQRYPMGALVSELLTVHQNEYVVRASVSVGGTVCATGMAAASTVEVAEDRAKERALKLLGIGDSLQTSRLDLGLRSLSIPSTPATPTPDVSPAPSKSLDASLSGVSVAPAPLPNPSSTAPLPNPLLEPEISAPKSVGKAIAPPPELDLDILQPQDVSPPAFDDELEGRSPHLDAPSLQENPPTLPLDELPDPAPTKKKPTKSTKSEAPKPTPESSEPQDSQDYSDIIAKIDVEMMRLGWNASKGREHLKTVYGKRSRQQLSYAELLDFLAHLEAQAS